MTKRKQLTLNDAYNQAVAHFNNDNLEKAKQFCDAITSAAPDHVDAINILGVIAQRNNRHDLAVAQFKKAVNCARRQWVHYHNLGISLSNLELYADAINAFRHALAIVPDKSNILLDLASIFEKTGNFQEAIASLQQAIALQPKLAAAHNNLAIILTNQGRLQEAVASFQQVLTITPDCVETLKNLGLILTSLGRLAEAIASYRQALAYAPNNLELHSKLGILFTSQGRLPEAVTSYKNALAIAPNSAAIHNNLGDAQRDLGHLDAAVISLRQAIYLQPDFAIAHNNLGETLKSLGKFSEAVASFKKAIALKPDYGKAHNNLLLCSQYIPDQTPEKLFALHKDWADHFFNNSNSEIFAHKNNQQTKRQLRLGLLSPNFRRHPIGYFMLGFFSHRQQKDVAIVGYADCQPDAITKQLAASADGWVWSKNLGDSELAKLIYEDRIDILIDLVGHTANNRLALFAQKPAPIQITWAGYVGTTGLKTMDWLLADSHYITADEEKYYSERIIKLPDSWVCYTPPDYTPPITKKPAKTSDNAFILGNFGNPAKINAKMLAAWAKILLQLPQAKLLLIYLGMDSTANSQRIKTYFKKAGIDPERIQIDGHKPNKEFLASYNSVDLALDTIPYSGGLTTLEALLMGVPVVTIRGATFAGRHSTSILSTTGLAELVTDDMDSYCQLVVDLANNRQRLAKLKAGLRNRLLNSPLCDYDKFSADLVIELKKVWLDWCKGRGKK